MDAYAATIASAIERRPVLAVVVTNAATALIAGATLLYVASEGQPLALIKRSLFRSVLAIVPKSIVDKEKEAMRAKVEASVVGHAAPGELSYVALPAVGLSRADVVAALERGCEGDRAKWSNGKVRAGRRVRGRGGAVRQGACEQLPTAQLFAAPPPALPTGLGRRVPRRRRAVGRHGGGVQPLRALQPAAPGPLPVSPQGAWCECWTRGCCAWGAAAAARAPRLRLRSSAVSLAPTPIPRRRWSQRSSR